MSRISEGQCGQFVNALNSCECTCNPASQSSWRMFRNFPAFSLENSFSFLFAIIKSHFILSQAICFQCLIKGFCCWAINSNQNLPQHYKRNSTRAQELTIFLHFQILSFLGSPHRVSLASIIWR